MKNAEIKKESNFVAKHLYQFNKPKVELSKKEKLSKKKFDKRPQLWS